MANSPSLQPDPRILLGSNENSPNRGVINDLIDGRAYQLQKLKLESESTRIDKNMDRYRQRIPSTSTPYSDINSYEKQSPNHPSDVINVILDNAKVRNQRRKIEFNQVQK